MIKHENNTHTTKRERQNAAATHVHTHTKIMARSIHTTSQIKDTYGVSQKNGDDEQQREREQL